MLLLNPDRGLLSLIACETCPAPTRSFSFPFQKEMFASKLDGGSDMRERKMSNSSSGGAGGERVGTKSKWMKAFKGIKGKDSPAPGEGAR